MRADHPVQHSWIRSHAPNITLGLMRVAAGLMFMQHGLQKLFGMLPMPGMPAFHPAMFSQLWFAGTLELVGGALIVLGLGTRVVALLLSGEMAVAYFQVHAPRGYWPVLNQGELAALYCFVFLGLAGLGAGAYSLDHLIAVARGKPKLRD
jgi:putative oxidoreductase